MRGEEVALFESYNWRYVTRTLRVHMAAHWAYISVDLFTLTADEARRVRYREVFSKIDRDLPNYSSSLRDQLQITGSDPPAYFWSAVWGGSGSRYTSSVGTRRSERALLRQHGPQRDSPAHQRKLRTRVNQ